MKAEIWGILPTCLFLVGNQFISIWKVQSNLAAFHFCPFPEFVLRHQSQFHSGLMMMAAETVNRTLIQLLLICVFSFGLAHWFFRRSKHRSAAWEQVVVHVHLHC